MLCASCSLGARPQVACRSPRLVGVLPRQGRLFGLVYKNGLLQLLLYRKRRVNGVALLTVEVGCILLVDVLLFLWRRIWTRGIETAVLHEIEIGVAAAWLAASGKFRAAFAKRRCLRLLARRLLGDVCAFLEISAAAPSPLPTQSRTR